MRTGRPTAPVKLTEHEREALQNWARRPKSAHALALRARMTHKTPLIHRWVVKRPRFHLHFTPTGTSWINQVERWFALLTEKRLRRGAFRSTRELEWAIRDYIDHHNDQPKPFRWAKTADQILENIARFCKRTSETAH